MRTHIPTHGGLSESFPPKSNMTHDGKGREGKGIGMRDVSPHASSQSLSTQPAPIAAPSSTSLASMHELLSAGGWA